MSRTPRLLTCILLIIFTASSLTAQTIIEGAVSDDKGQRVAYSQVILKSESCERILYYTQADDQGKFKLEVEHPGNYVISFHALSRKTLFYPVTILEDREERKEINVTLESEIIKITEVVVTATAPVRIKKDTVIYNAASFLMGEEKVAEDLLKRLPGVSVDEGGAIHIKGREIEKIMIEGDDLFDKGYRIISKNMHVGVIDKVEVLLNYSDRPLMADMENNEKVAINLTLNEESKAQLFGNISLGYSTTGKYEVRTTLMHLRKKNKLYVFGNSNNLGYDPLGDVRNLAYPSYSVENYVPFSFVEPRHLINLKTYRPDLNENRIKFNNSGMISINWIYSPFKNLKLKAVSFFSVEKENYFRDRYIQYLSEELSFTHNEEYRLRDKFNNSYVKLEGCYKINSFSQIDYKGINYLNNGLAISDLLINQNKTLENLKNSILNTDQTLMYIRRPNSKRVLLISGRFFSDRRSETFGINPFRFGELFPGSEQIKNLEQNISNSLLFSGAEITNIFRVHNKLTLHIKGGIAIDQNKVSSGLHLTDSVNVSRLTGNDYRNNLVLTTTGIYAGITFEWRVKKIICKASLESKQVFHELLFLNKESDTNGRVQYLEPKLIFDWHINNKNSVKGTFSSNTTATSADEVSDGKILTGYQTFLAGTGKFDLMRGYLMLLSFNHGSWLARKHVNASVMYFRQSDYLGSDAKLTADYNIFTKIHAQGKETYLISVANDFYIRPLQHNLKLFTNVSHMHYVHVINDNVNPIRFTGLDYGTEFRSVFRSFFNYHIGTKWIFQRMTAGTESYTYNQKHFIDFSFKINKSVLFIIKGERYHFDGLDQGNSTWHFIDASLSCNLKPNKWKLSFEANNLLNIRNFGTYIVDDIALYSFNYRIIPGYIMMKISCRL